MPPEEIKSMSQRPELIQQTGEGGHICFSQRIYGNFISFIIENNLSFILPFLFDILCCAWKYSDGNPDM